ncbi:MAG TPA: FtsX-like permease family protein [Acidimicrobiales bacterium]|nr:FtsX-like permease family protein [Acidimicrobiales bacterium]
MLKVALRGLWGHKLRLIITFIAVALGVAFIGGVLVLTDTMNRAFDDLFANVYKDTDAVVRSDQKVDSDFGPEIRGNIDESLVKTVQGARGVSEAEGNVGGFARVIDRNGDPVGNPGMGAPTLGGNWNEVDALNPFNISAGRPPSSEGQVVIDKKTADDTGFGPGDKIRVQTRDGVNTFEVSGVARFGTQDSPGGASYVLWTLPSAQRLMGEPGKVSTVAATAESGVSQEQLARNIREVLPKGSNTQVITGKEIINETQDTIKSGLRFLTVFFLIFAIIAVVVGSFVIYNSFTIIVAQRTREMALLRAVGARRKQVRRAVLAEAVIVGLVGSAVGFLAGLGIATFLATLLSVPEGALAIVPSSLITAIATGVIVTVFSALLPAWRASRVPPLAAMREVAVDTTGRSRVRLTIGLVLMVLGVALVLVGAFGASPAQVGIGVALAFLAILFLAPTLARPVGNALGAPVARLRGVAGQLARDNAARNPRRTASTAAALTIGVGLVSFILIINSSIRASFDKTLEENFGGDFVVDSGTFGAVGMPPSVARKIGALPDVKLAAPIRFQPAFVNGKGTTVTGSDPGIFDMLDIKLIHGSGDLGQGDVVVSKTEAAAKHLKVGDTITLAFIDDARLRGRPGAAAPKARVAGISEAGPTGGIGNYTVGLADFDAAVPNPTDVQVFVQLKPGVTVAEAEPTIKRTIDEAGLAATAKVQSVDEYKDQIGSQLNVFLVIIGALLVLALIIAMLGIVNTIVLSVLERTRELGLLRAVGMRRRQVRAAVRWESAIISLFGTVLGLAVGILGGWGIVRALRDEGFQVFQLPIVFLLLVSAAGVLAGLFAALLPAWAAGRMNVLDAINTE